MVLLTPSSIAHSGTSASIGANGQVTFTAVTSLSLNGVFSADFDNYVISMRDVVSTGGEQIRMRLRVSGSDASGTNYTVQNIVADGTSVTATRSTSQTSLSWGDVYNTQRDGRAAHIYGPFLAQPTAVRSVGVSSGLSALIGDFSSTHSLSTSYDGFTIFPSAQNITGALQVYGVRS